MEQRRHFDLDAQVAEWRRWQERTSSLSPRELDELEDHLRAHVDLEVELNPGLGLPRSLRRRKPQPLSLEVSKAL